MSMLDHIQITVQNVARSREFYAAALEPLGYTVQYDKAPVVGIGAKSAKIPALWLSEGEAKGATHVALIAPSRKAVDAFHRAAVSAGGRDNGPAGLRPDYHAAYYAAFVIDPDGNNLEAVCHQPA
jgi:catechol 2,3-dioxygenase-like lactoylglutathione lyase family enzyme